MRRMSSHVSKSSLPRAPRPDRVRVVQWIALILLCAVTGAGAGVWLLPTLWCIGLWYALFPLVSVWTGITGFLSRGAVRAFFLVASVVAMPLASVGLLLFFSLLLAMAYDPTQLWTSLGEKVDAPMVMLVGAPLGLLWTSGAVAGLLVWAARGPLPREGVREYRRRQRLRIIVTVGVVGLIWVMTPVLPQSLGLPIIIMLGYILAPAMAIVGIGCGRKRVRAFSLGASVPIIFLPVSLYIGWLVIATKFDETVWTIEAVLTFWSGGLLLPLSGWICLTIQMSLHRHETVWRRQKGEANACCATTSSLFPTATCCNGSCGFE